MNRFEIDRLLTTCRGYIQGAIKSYSNCMTQGEIEQWLYTNFLKIVESQENVIDAFIELKEWVVNEGMKTAIVEQLQEWLADGTITNIINVELFGEIKKDIEILKTKSKIHFIKTTLNADCIVIQTDNGKNVMIDSGVGTEVAQTKEELSKLGITKIDYFILSHYDYDHMGGLALLDNIDFSSCEFFLPQIPNQATTPPNVWKQYEEVMNFVMGRNYIFPTENQILNVGNDIIKFINTDHTLYYISDNFEYNNCCLCCVYETQKTKTLFTGDISIDAQKYLVASKKIEKVDILKLNHHGMDVSLYLDYLQYAYPTMTFVTNGTGNSNFEYYAINRQGKAVRYLDSQGIPIFAVAENGTITVEIENGIFRTKAKTTKISNGLKTYNSHVEILNDSVLSKKLTQVKMRDLLDSMESNSIAYLNLDSTDVVGDFFGDYLGTTKKSVLIMKSASSRNTDHFLYSNNVKFYQATILCFGISVGTALTEVMRTNVYVNPDAEPNLRLVADHYPIKSNSYCSIKMNERLNGFMKTNPIESCGNTVSVETGTENIIINKSGKYKISVTFNVSSKTEGTKAIETIQILRNSTVIKSISTLLLDKLRVTNSSTFQTSLSKGDIVKIRGGILENTDNPSVEIFFEYLSLNYNSTMTGDMTTLE